MTDVTGIYARELPFLDRYVQLGIAQGRVISVDFPTKPDSTAIDEHPLLDRIEAYVQGDRDGFSDVTVALTGPTDQRVVLEQVREIPYGDEITVEQLGQTLPDNDPDEKSDLMDIREALKANPAPLLIPTHRVRDGPSGLPASVDQKFRSIEGL